MSPRGYGGPGFVCYVEKRKKALLSLVSVKLIERECWVPRKKEDWTSTFPWKDILILIVKEVLVKSHTTMCLVWIEHCKKLKVLMMGGSFIVIICHPNMQVFLYNFALKCFVKRKLNFHNTSSKFWTNPPTLSSEVLIVGQIQIKPLFPNITLAPTGKLWKCVLLLLIKEGNTLIKMPWES